MSLKKPMSTNSWVHRPEAYPMSVTVGEKQKTVHLAHRIFEDLQL